MSYKNRMNGIGRNKEMHSLHSTRALQGERSRKRQQQTVQQGTRVTKINTAHQPNEERFRAGRGPN